MRKNHKLQEAPGNTHQIQADNLIYLNTSMPKITLQHARNRVQQKRVAELNKKYSPRNSKSL